MRICPQCGAEYVDERRLVCADCGEPLVYPPEDADGPRVEYVPWEPLLGVPNLVVGVLVVGVLREVDIPARLEEHSIPAYGGIPSSPFRDSWGAVYVPAQLVDLAREVVEDYLEGLEELNPMESQDHE